MRVRAWKPKSKFPKQDPQNEWWFKMLIALNFSKQIIRKSSHGGNEDFQTNLHICTAGRFLVHIWMTDENLCSECLENFVSEQYRIILIYFSFVFQIYSLKDLPGFLACFSSKITKPMIDSTTIWSVISFFQLRWFQSTYSLPKWLNAWFQMWSSSNKSPKLKSKWMN